MFRTDKSPSKRTYLCNSLPHDVVMAPTLDGSIAGLGKSMGDNGIAVKTVFIQHWRQNASDCQVVGKDGWKHGVCLGPVVCGEACYRHRWVCKSLWVTL